LYVDVGVTCRRSHIRICWLYTSRKIYSQTEDFGNGEHSAEWLYGITEQLHGLRFLGVGGSISKLCSQKALDKIDDTGITDNDESQSGRLIWMIQLIFGRLETAR
jgi:hypothetical protein